MRFQGHTHKLLADLNGRPVWRHSFDHLLAAALDHVIVVTGAAALDTEPLRETAAEVIVCHNARWDAGQGSSLALAIATANELGANAIVVGLADQPFVTTSAWQAVAGAPPGWPIVVATYDGARGPHPIRLTRDVWPVIDTDGDEGARQLLTQHPSWVHEVACVGSTSDIDTLEDLHRWTHC